MRLLVCRIGRAPETASVDASKAGLLQKYSGDLELLCCSSATTGGLWPRSYIIWGLADNVP